MIRQYISCNFALYAETRIVFRKTLMPRRGLSCISLLPVYLIDDVDGHIQLMHGV